MPATLPYSMQAMSCGFYFYYIKRFVIKIMVWCGIGYTYLYRWQKKDHTVAKSFISFNSSAI